MWSLVSVVIIRQVQDNNDCSPVRCLGQEDDRLIFQNSLMTNKG